MKDFDDSDENPLDDDAMEMALFFDDDGRSNVGY